MMNSLIIDDDLYVVNEMMNILQGYDELGIHRITDSEKEALGVIEKEDVDVVILETKTKNINGVELAKKIKNLKPRINIIFVTNHEEYALEAHKLYVSAFLMKLEVKDNLRIALEHLRYPVNNKKKSKLRIQCFGNFEVFSGKEVVAFKRSKSKELLAYLVDRKGATCTMGELLAVIWEDKPDTDSQRSQLRTLIHDLRITLSELSADEVLKRGHNTLAINAERIQCDYYELLNNEQDIEVQYQGEYMKQYSWAEVTAAELQKRKAQIRL